VFVVISFGSSANLLGSDPNSCGTHQQIYVYNTCGTFYLFHGCHATLYLASRSSDSTLGDSDSSNAAVSADGNFLAYQTLADNLWPSRPGNALPKVLVEQLCRSTLAFSPTGQAATCVISPSLVSAGNATTPSISEDGRYVAFVSAPASSTRWVFVQDTCGGSNAPTSGCSPQTNIVSVDDSGHRSNADSLSPSISADGSTVTFQSSATNLVSGFGDGMNPQVFVHGPFACIFSGFRSHCTVKTIAISGANGTWGKSPSISASGRYVAYQELTIGGGTTIADIRVADTCADLSFFTVCTGSSNIASTPTPKSWIIGPITPPSGGEGAPSISADGHTVSYTGTAKNTASNIVFALTGY
jgi:hypothetical protein